MICNAVCILPNKTVQCIIQSADQLIMFSDAEKTHEIRCTQWCRRFTGSTRFAYLSSTTRRVLPPVSGSAWFELVVRRWSLSLGNLNPPMQKPSKRLLWWMVTMQTLQCQSWTAWCWTCWDDKHCLRQIEALSVALAGADETMGAASEQCQMSFLENSCLEIVAPSTNVEPTLEINTKFVHCLCFSKT